MPVEEKLVSERRLAPRYPAEHEAEGTSPNGGIKFRGLLHDLSATGCQLLLDTRLPPGDTIELQCDIAGIGVWLRGEVVWSSPTGQGFNHGVVLTGFGSQGDSLFYRLYIRRIASRQTGSLASLDRPRPN